MNLETIRLMTDFGLLVLIWIVQLIIYPGFAFIEFPRFDAWHKRYMVLITYVVAPLMFLQAGLVGFQIITRGNWSNWISLVLVSAVWLLTFLTAVPIHNKLGQKEGHFDRIGKLVKVNWYRTLIWSLLWVISLLDIYFVG